MKASSNKSILFFGKKDDENCKKAACFIEDNFITSEIHLGEWKDPFPDNMRWPEYDYIVSYLSRWIIPDDLLEKSRIAAMNFHPASPDYPGIGCNNFALYDEAEFYGVTCHYMTSAVDTGSIIDTKTFPVFSSDSVATLLSRTYDFQLVLFYEIMGTILRGDKLPSSNKNWTRKPYTRKEFDELATITADMKSEEVRKRIRATNFCHWKPTVKIGGFVFEYKQDR